MEFTKYSVVNEPTADPYIWVNLDKNNYSLSKRKLSELLDDLIIDPKASRHFKFECRSQNETLAINIKQELRKSLDIDSDVYKIGNFWKVSGGKFLLYPDLPKTYQDIIDLINTYMGYIESFRLKIDVYNKS